MGWVALGVGLVIGAVAGALAYITNMPRSSHADGLAPLNPAERSISLRLRSHVEMLAGEIGGRSVARPESLSASLAYIEAQLRNAGYATARQEFQAAGVAVANVEATLSGSDRIIIVGAHYDTAAHLPGANDNASGVAATLELASMFAGSKLGKTIRFVFFVNEEPPFFQGPEMGSYVYARRCRERNEKVDAMISLETIGYYSNEPRSQQYPIGFHPGYPDRGNFLGFVADLRSAPLLRRAVGSFRKHTSLPVEGAAAPAVIPGVGWSDHWSFWQFGYPALMVTDTAPYRYAAYHTPYDTPDKLDYERMARAVTGVAGVVQDLAGG